MRICVIGAGYVGLTTGACLAAIGHQVTCVDADHAKLTALRAGRIPIFEERLPEVIAAARAQGNLLFSLDGPAALQTAEIIFICVGTPPDADGKANLAAVEAVARDIAAHARACRLVVSKSTVPVHTSNQIRRILEVYGHDLDCDVASNPEFLREGTGVYDFFHPDRLVVGCDRPASQELLRALYAPVLEGSCHCGWHDLPASRCGWRPPAWVATSTASAELIKHASNSFLSMKISYANAIADVCELAGADAAEVLQGIGLDRRIGSEFLCPGLGFGGFCFPKDLSAFIQMSSDLGYDFQLLCEVQAINARRIDQFLRKIRQALWVVEGKTLGVLGLAFKAGTDDVRLSPALAVIRELLRLGARLRVYDPQAMERARAELPATMHFCGCAEEVADGADGILILTDWPQFRAADWRTMGDRMRRRLLLDGRNLFTPAEAAALNFEHYGVGRGRPRAVAVAV